MSHIAFPYILTLAVLLFVIGLYAVLTREGRGGIASGTYVMLSGVCIGALGFVSFLPAYFVKQWTGYAMAVLGLAMMTRAGLRGIRGGK